MTAETFSPGTTATTAHRIITNLVKLIRQEQVEMLLPISMVDNEHLK